MYLLHIAMQFEGIVPLDAYAYGKDDFTRDYLHRSSDVVRATDLLRSAVRKRFGAACLEMLELSDRKTVMPRQFREAMESMGDQGFAELDRTPFRIEGDQASVQSGDDVGHLKRVNGNWMVEMCIAENLRRFVEPAPVTDFAIRLSSEFAHRINSGEFHDAAALKLEMQARGDKEKAELEKRGIGFPYGIGSVAHPTTPPAPK